MLDAIRAESFAQGVNTRGTHLVGCGQLSILSVRFGPVALCAAGLAGDSGG